MAGAKPLGRLVAIVIAVAGLCASPARGEGPELRLCTQNLFNWGLPEEVHRLRRENDPMEAVQRDLARQRTDLVGRLSGCDVVAVQEVLGGTAASARQGLQWLADGLKSATGVGWSLWTADSADVIRNGFLVRENASVRVASFDGSHAGEPVPPLDGFPRGTWSRAPAEIALTWVGKAPAATSLPAPAPGRSGSAPGRGGAANTEPAGRARTVPISGASGPTIRILTAHLKSHRGGENDPFEEDYERIRVVQAAALEEMARSRLARDPRMILLVMGDVNGDRETPTQLVLTGRLEPLRLIHPKDCIGPGGTLACDLPFREPLLQNLLAEDPDLSGRGSYRYGRKDQLMDVILASPEAARLAAEPGKARDWDVALAGQYRRGSDHLMGRVILRLP